MNSRLAKTVNHQLRIYLSPTKIDELRPHFIFGGGNRCGDALAPIARHVDDRALQLSNALHQSRLEIDRCQGNQTINSRGMNAIVRKPPKKRNAWRLSKRELPKSAGNRCLMRQPLLMAPHPILMTLHPNRSFQTGNSFGKHPHTLNDARI